MLAEIFQKPKPILGTLQLLALPGAPAWEGQMDTLLDRAEQEALALASGGVDGILIENTGDYPYRKERMEVAGAIAMAQVAQRVQQYTQLPVGISVLQNDPETALAIALNIKATFVRVPVLIGGLMSENGLIEGKLQAILEAKQTLKLPVFPKLLVNLSTDHWLPGTPLHASQGEPLQHLSHLTDQLTNYGLADGYLLQANLLTPEEIKALQTRLRPPLLLEDPPLTQAAAYYKAGHGLLLTNNIKKKALRFGAESRETVDMVKVEEILQQLDPHRAWAHMMPRNSEDLALYQGQTRS